MKQKFLFIGLLLLSTCAFSSSGLEPIKPPDIWLSSARDTYAEAALRFTTPSNAFIETLGLGIDEEIKKLSAQAEDPPGRMIYSLILHANEMSDQLKRNMPLTKFLTPQLQELQNKNVLIFRAFSQSMLQNILNLEQLIQLVSGPDLPREILRLKKLNKIFKECATGLSKILKQQNKIFNIAEAAAKKGQELHKKLKKSRIEKQRIDHQNFEEEQRNRKIKRFVQRITTVRLEKYREQISQLVNNARERVQKTALEREKNKYNVVMRTLIELRELKRAQRQLQRSQRQLQRAESKMRIKKTPKRRKPEKQKLLNCSTYQDSEPEPEFNFDLDTEHESDSESESEFDPFSVDTSLYP